ncbi:hypothetical protein EVAR_53873_1 [Eumeta japonica]|uniref:Uncharacterized protein n=1 Tax=Eumeta variegata TaxID=151549 RepID=A0A4C1XIS6_EUMVA|nr:hypothetical protein EVAR_53873_1 [Eumeta japonica]
MATPRGRSAEAKPRHNSRFNKMCSVNKPYIRIVGEKLGKCELNLLEEPRTISSDNKSVQHTLELTITRSELGAKLRCVVSSLALPQDIVYDVELNVHINESFGGSFSPSLPHFPPSNILFPPKRPKHTRDPRVTIDHGTSRVAEYKLRRAKPGVCQRGESAFKTCKLKVASASPPPP